MTRGQGSGEPSRRVVLVGAGRLGVAIAARLPPSWTLVAVDLNAAVEAPLRAVRADATLVVGDGTSRLVLARARLDPKTVLIAATGDDATNREVARVALESFGVEERVVVVAERGADEPGAPDPVVTVDAVAGRVVNRVSVGGARAIEVGLGIGELLQVTVLEGSPAAGRTLRELGARTWLVGAVYRGDHLIVPHGDTRIEAGDRVLLVGDPSVLEDVAPFFRGGAPVFPSQYGARIGYCGDEGARRTAMWLADRVGAAEVLAVGPLGGDGPDPDLAAADVGCMVMDPRPLPWYVRLGLVASRLHGAIVAARRPVLIARSPPPYTGVLLCVRDARAERDVVLAALDLARQVDAPVSAVTVGAGAPTVRADLDRLARLHGVELPHRHEVGNPVTRIRAAASPAHLVVAGIRPEHNGPLAPDVSVHLLHDTPGALLLVPWASGA